ncbi:hypothetical protein M8J76_004911 [Diaphorina citri]|nr:hypothetical protein M8J75_005235 [Diaphorina citri]KAI5749140.1 hypothetical protein M8J76_004911 [Diaphorina citri]KAI5756337.1 hypothetical protein M8J77_024159 [Diaphorina citri]
MVKIKKKLKRSLKEAEKAEPKIELPPPSRNSDEPIAKKRRWINKQRVLIFASRGISFTDRHLMKNLQNMLPHSRPGTKMERKDTLTVVNEICEMKNCNKCILFEGRLRRDLYMWFANVHEGPSLKCLVESVFTMGELKLTGNSLKGSRPLLSFDEKFSQEPHYRLMQELLTQIFGTPKDLPKSQPFIDHVISFSILDNRIWFRNYQILSEDGALVEIGPRFCLNPIKIFAGGFGGKTIWENPHYISPAKFRQQLKRLAGQKYELKNEEREKQKQTKEMLQIEPADENDISNILRGDILKKAKKLTAKPIDLKKESDKAETRATLTEKKKIKEAFKMMKKQKEKAKELSKPGLVMKTKDGKKINKHKLKRLKENLEQRKKMKDRKKKAKKQTVRKDVKGE